MSEQASTLDRFRQPEYTGENRCIPCTAVNVVIAAAGSALLAVLAPPVGAVAFVLSLAAIYFRGYLVPGTPTLTKRYLPASVLQVFDKHPAEERSTTQEFETLQKLEDERKNGVTPDQFLLDIDAIELCEDGEDYCLTDGFGSEIDAQAQRIDDEGIDYGDVATIFGDDPEDVEVLDRDYPAIQSGIRTRKWPSEAAIITDLATHRALGERTDRWPEVPDTQRPQILESLRGFQDHCFACDGDIVYDEAVVDSCCGQHEVKSYACTDCGQHLLEFDQARVGDEVSLTGMTP